MKKIPVLRIVFILVLFAVITIAIVQNLSMATVKFLVFGVSAPVIAVILTSLLFGFIIGLLVSPLLSIRGSNPSKPKEQNKPSQTPKG